MHQTAKGRMNARLIRERCLYTRVRLLCMSREELAKALAYANITPVFKMEKETSKTSINHSYIFRLADFAGVSTDFLYGRSSYPERDPQTIEQLAVFNASKSFVEEKLQLFSKMIIGSVEVNSISWRLERIQGRFKEFYYAWQRYLELNPEFEEEAKGGARVIKAIETLEKEVYNAICHSDKIKRNDFRLKAFESALSEDSKQIDFVGKGYDYCG